MPQYDDHDDLAALDFSAVESGSDTLEESDALDFSAPADDDEESAVDALHDYAPTEPVDSDTDLAAIESQTDATSEAAGDAEEAPQEFTVTNPPETVTVSALMDGRTQRVELSAKVTSMSEAELADEILVIADLARQKGLAAQHSYLLEDDSLSETMREMGVDGGDVVRDFMENGIGLITPEQAAAAQAEVFATRYATDK
ncbi:MULTISPECIES: hypothetical protein [unclassified Mycobacterium]|uniref:hypothetical protein n=1 Tax=unclassified Mycobacterium TaxID=2642494 RepID=UPI000800AA74|nr:MULTISPECIES: hypothetical protein [unclassified Mycobacterium]OBG65091.1 hypothetical protein A5704_12765 [Mycobacterium sp. E735]OBG71415.1 hypothetical protein A9X05_28340 [Mycobacterium sp. E3298]OBG75848.1 hypothetical protein A5701_20560 [Mycobacterium sp. E3305]OBH12950.1 hypothetical protein A9X03_25505 [Mycobacterium sp. E1715]